MVDLMELEGDPILWSQLDQELRTAFNYLDMVHDDCPPEAWPPIILTTVDVMVRHAFPKKEATGLRWDPTETVLEVVVFATPAGLTEWETQKKALASRLTNFFRGRFIVNVVAADPSLAAT